MSVEELGGRWIYIVLWMGDKLRVRGRGVGGAPVPRDAMSKMNELGTKG